jgi:hypothetical protein
MRCTIGLQVVLLLCISKAVAYLMSSGLVRPTSALRPREASFMLFAKKKNTKATSKGFGSAPVEEAVEVVSVLGEVEQTLAAAETTTKDRTSNSEDIDLDSLTENDADIIFKKYGISTEDAPKKKKGKKGKEAGKAKRSEDAAFGQDVIAGIPLKLQKQIDEILITGTFIALTFVILCGIGERTTLVP